MGYEGAGRWALIDSNRSLPSMILFASMCIHGDGRFIEDCGAVILAQAATGS